MSTRTSIEGAAHSWRRTQAPPTAPVTSWSSSSRRPRRRRSRATSGAATSSSPAIGHIRDLPQRRRRRARQVQGRDVGPPRRRRRQRLRAALRRHAGQEGHRSPSSRTLLKDADELFLATDEDREGEAIAWHLLRGAQAQGAGRAGWSSTRSPRRRSAPRSPTRATSTRTWSTPRRPGASSTGSTATRSRPVLWKKVMPRLSAGRVQSVATRLVVERERERIAFRTASYWDLDAHLRRRRRSTTARIFPARLHSRRRRAGRPRAATSTAAGRAQARRATSCTSTRPRAEALAARLQGSRFDGRLASSRSPTAAARTRRSAPRRCSRRPAASSASPRSGRCGRAAALRERLHHLHAYRLDDAVRDRDRRGPARRSRELYGADYLPDQPRRLHHQGQERAGGARGDPARRRDLPHPGRRPG